MTSLWQNFQGNAIYLDTMVPYALLRGIEPSAKELFAQIEQGKFQAFTSALTFDELAYRLILAYIKDNYSGSPLDHLRQTQAKMIAEFYPQIAPSLAQLRSFPNLTVLSVTIADLQAMDDAILKFHLRPRDALHLAAMQKCDCLNLISQDSDFDQVPIVKRYTLG